MRANVFRGVNQFGIEEVSQQLPYQAFAAGLGDHRIVTTLCPGGKESMRRLMNMVESDVLTRSRSLSTRSRLMTS